MTFILFLLSILCLVLWITLKSRLDALQTTVARKSADAADLESELGRLTSRVYGLEQTVVRLRNEVEDKGRIPAEPQQSPPRPIVEEPSVMLERAALVDQPVAKDPEPEESSPPPFPVSIPLESQASIFEKLRQQMTGTEWESLVGGSVLNKLGALVLVVGVALFLAYSFAYMSPGGRASVSVALSLSLIGIGIWVERRNTYRVFSRGLMGAGWAALYVTTYAISALPAARVITNPLAGSLLLLAVAAGMIGHSLRYRVQTVTSLAFFCAFASLAVTPSTPFAVIGLLPLAGALLYLAWRFEWYTMGLFGLVATWGTCISRDTPSASPDSTEALFIAYWLIFETFDLLRLRRGNRDRRLDALLPLNGIAFLSLSYLTWHSHAPAELWKGSALASMLFLASALLRLSLNSMYEVGLTTAAALAGLSIFGRAPGLWASVGTAFEAELLYLAGVRFRLRFFRALGSVAFLFSLGGVLDRGEAPSRDSFSTGLLQFSWTPAVLLHAFFFYLNRYVWRSSSLFSWAATVLISRALLAEARSGYEGLALLLFTIVLLEVGLRKALMEFRLQAYSVTLIASLAIVGAHLNGFRTHPAPAVWISTTGAAIVCWLITSRILQTDAAVFHHAEFRVIGNGSASLGTAHAMLTLWMLVPGSAVPLAWLLLGIAWVELGLLLKQDSFRILGNAVALLADLELFRRNSLQPNPITWLENGVPFLTGLLYLARRQWSTAGPIAGSLVPRVELWLAAALAFVLGWQAAPHYWIATTWAILSLILITAGVRLRQTDLRIQGYFGVVLASVQCIGVNSEASEAAARLERIGSNVLTILTLFLSQAVLRMWRLKDNETILPFERFAKPFISIAAVTLLSLLLFHEVSGGLLTVAWGVEGVSLLAAGLSFRERVLRLEGLVLLLICILKLFVYDLRNLETLYRILSFIALGVILLCVSWIYTRFRERLNRYL